MRAYVALIGATAVVIAVILVAPGFSTLVGSPFNGNARTYNEGSNADMQNITVSVGDQQYSGAITNTVDYHQVTVVDSYAQDTRTVQYVPTSTGTVIYETNTIEICELGVLDITVTATETPDSCTVYIEPVSGTMTGTFYLRYWVDPANNLDRESVAPTGVLLFDTTDGCNFSIDSVPSHVVVSLCLAAVPVASVQQALNDVSFSIRAVANDNGGGS